MLANSHLVYARSSETKQERSLALASDEFISQISQNQLKSSKRRRRCSSSETEGDPACDVYQTQPDYATSAQATTRWKKYALAPQIGCGPMQYVLTAVEPSEGPSVCASLGLVSKTEESCCKGLKRNMCAKQCNLQCHDVELCKHQKDDCAITTIWTHCGKMAVPCRHLRCDTCMQSKLMTFEDVPIGDNYYYPYTNEAEATEWDYDGFHLINYKIYYPGRNSDYANEINSVISSNLVIGTVVTDVDAILSRKKPFTLASMFVTLIELAPLGMYHEGLVTIRAFRKNKLVATREVTINSNAPVLFAPSGKDFKGITTLSITPPPGLFFNIDNMLLCM